MNKLYRHIQSLKGNEFNNFFILMNKEYVSLHNPLLSHNLQDKSKDLLCMKQSIYDNNNIKLPQVTFDKKIVLNECNQYDYDKWNIYIMFQSWLYCNLICKHNNKYPNLEIENIESKIDIFYNKMNIHNYNMVLQKSHKLQYPFENDEHYRIIGYGKRRYYDFPLHWNLYTSDYCFLGKVYQQITLKN
jgi:hypothetical protein